MRAEIERQILIADEEYNRKFAACVLWALHEVFGMGPVRLKRYFDAYDQLHTDLRKHYELSEDDQQWIVERKLREIGVDLDEWYKG